MALALALGCGKADETKSTEQPTSKQDSPLELTGEARGRRMLLESRNCLIAPDAERAAACRIACELAHSNSCYRAGRHLERANHVARAMERYQQGCKGGSGTACRAAGRMYAHGIGVAVDAARAVDLYASARRHGRVHCDRGHAASCLAIGEMFAAGEGGRVDRRAAAMYLQRACSYKLQHGCAALTKLGK